jgi:hypothetical protein
VAGVPRPKDWLDSHFLSTPDGVHHFSVAQVQAYVVSAAAQIKDEITRLGVLARDFAGHLVLGA